MNGFIEVTDKDELVKMLIPIEKILYIVDFPEGVSIDVMSFVKGSTISIEVAESYEEVKYRLNFSYGGIRI